MVFAKTTARRRMVTSTALALVVVASTSSSLARAAAPSAAEVDVAAMLGSAAALTAWLERYDPEVAIARAQAAQASAEVRAAGMLPNPVLDLGVDNIPLGKTSPPGLGWSQTNVYSVGLSETFELGKRGPRTEAARLRLASAEQRARGALVTRIAEARLTLGRVVYLGARQRMFEERLAAARRIAEVERTRLEQGALSGQDHDRLLLETTSLGLEAAEASAEHALALTECRAVMRAPCRAPSSADGLDAAASVPAARPSTRAEPAEVLALKLDGQAARADATLARRRAIPDLTLRLGYSHSQFTVSGDIANTLSASLSVPLPIFDHGQADLARAAARAQELDSAGDAQQRTVRAALEGYWTQKASLEAAASELETHAIPRSAGVLSATEEAFKRGQADTTSLLLAQRAHRALVQEHLDLRFKLFAVRNQLRRALELDLRAQKEPQS